MVPWEMEKGLRTSRWQCIHSQPTLPRDAELGRPVIETIENYLIILERKGLQYIWNPTPWNNCFLWNITKLPFQILLHG
jgi:hypothetical protein